MADFITQARALYPFLPEALLSLFEEKYIEFDKNLDLALGAVRQDDNYDNFFPGNKRADGSVRLSESEYGAVIESYKDDLRKFGVNPDIFADNFGQLVEGDVSPSELQSRLNTVYSGIEQNIPEVQQYYADNFGIDLSTESIFAAAVDTDIGDAILSGQITQSQIAGEAIARDIQISQTEIERLQRFGLGQQQARQLFQTAQQEVPRLQELQTRGGRQVAQEDVIGVEEFTEAAVFRSPEELEEIKLLEAEEASRFTPIGGAARRGGRVTGLTQQ
tara:strand:+ start:8773 stop:9597 length:825 start_codon:yes stop_codon:yes gene_type:complete